MGGCSGADYGTILETRHWRGIMYVNKKILNLNYCKINYQQQLDNLGVEIEERGKYKIMERE